MLEERRKLAFHHSWQPALYPTSFSWPDSGVATRDTVAIVSRCFHNGSHILQKWQLKCVVNDVLRSVIIV